MPGTATTKQASSPRTKARTCGAQIVADEVGAGRVGQQVAHERQFDAPAPAQKWRAKGLGRAAG